MILPYAALASRSFQPDPLLTHGGSCVGMVGDGCAGYRQQTWKRGGDCRLAGRDGDLLQVHGLSSSSDPAWMGIDPVRDGLQTSPSRSKQVWALGGLTVLPYALFHIYGVYIVDLLGGQFAMRFFPNLWIDPVTYLRWKGDDR